MHRTKPQSRLSIPPPEVLLLLALALCILGCGSSDPCPGDGFCPATATQAMQKCDPDSGCPGGPGVNSETISVKTCNDSGVTLPFRVAWTLNPGAQQSTGVVLSDESLSPGACVVSTHALSAHPGDTLEIGASVSVANDYANWAWRLIDVVVPEVPLSCVLRYGKDAGGGSFVSISCDAS